jgi:molecular chaperone GrpE
MSDERHGNGPEERGEVEPQVKVVDRRRFTPEGEPVGPDEPSSAAGGTDELQAPDPRDATIAQQASRIDELLRALAASVDEGRAARARLERQTARVLEAERATMAGVLLEAIDELERALAAAGDAAGPLVDGVRLTLASVTKKVQELGAERISLVGSRFDPLLAEAIDLVPVSDAAQDERVVAEVRAGYRIGEKVLRPARVRVGRFVQA